MNLPIRARMTIWSVALLALILVALGSFLVERLRSDLIRGLDDTLATRAGQIAIGLRGGCEGEFPDASGSSLTGLPIGESGAQLLGRDGSVRESAGDAVANVTLLDSAGVRAVVGGGTVRTTVSLGADGEPFRVLAVPSTGACPGVIAVATSLDEVDRSVHSLLVLLLVAGPAALVAVGFGSWLLAGRSLRPVARMTSEARRLRVSSRGERIEVLATGDEISRLGVTLNEMLERVQWSVDEQRRFVADASHELRTPLAIMTSEIDVALDDPTLDPAAREVLESAHEEVDRMRDVIENLLTLARLDEPEITLLREDVDLRTIALDVEARLEPLATARGVQVVVQGPPTGVSADAALMTQVMTNLMKNAIDHANAETTVRVEVWLDDRSAGFDVSDSGPGIDSDALPHVFDRFFRADPSRSSARPGSGLGLAISRAIVTAHGGGIGAESRPGDGSTFSVTLPTTLAAFTDGRPDLSLAQPDVTVSGKRRYDRG
jgi:heavy metal sensor kinase